jgi:hypothetical protein
MLFLRRLKQNLFVEAQFRRYIGYAGGEIVLVVVGILLALRIDTWHEQRQTQRAIDDYLDSIARNIREDLVEIEALRAKRGTTMFASRVARWNMSWLTSYSVAEIEYASNALKFAREQHFFSANTSGYEGLKNSGHLSNLGDLDIETLLFEYNETAARIRRFEENHDDYLRGLSLQFTSRDHSDLMTIFQEPGFVAPDEFVDAKLQSDYRKLMLNPVVQAWYEASDVQTLLLYYERLLELGRLTIDRIQRGRDMSFEAAATDSIYDPNSGLGYANVLEDGRLAWHTYTIDWAPTPDGAHPGIRGTFNSDIRAASFTDSALGIAYPGIDQLGGSNWAAIFIEVGKFTPSTSRYSKDFSAFGTLRLEMKGEHGGETFWIHLKDTGDPDDGTQSNIPVTLTDEWQTYDFDLASFETANLSKLFIVTGFLFEQQPEPVKFSVRNITFLRPGDS